jgi:anti-sigma-K factor RskA
VTTDDHLLVGAYAVGALDRSEALTFEAHLARCDSCRTEVAELTETAALLAVAVPAPASEPLLDRVMEQVRATPQLPPVRPSPGRINGNPSRPPARFADTGGSVASPRRPTARRAPWLLGAAAAIALVLLAGTMATRMLGERTGQDEMLAIIEDPAAEHFTLEGVPGEATAGTTIGVHVRASTGQAVVDARSLPALDERETYELWFMAGGTPRRAVTFDPGDDGTAQVLFTAPVPDPDAFGVTVEPAGGSDTPTSPIVFEGTA